MPRKAKPKMQVLDLTGNLSIERVQEIYTALEERLKEATKLFIRLEKAQGIDVSVIQLIYAAQYEAEKKGKTLAISGEVPSAIKESLIIGGFMRDKTDQTLFGISKESQGA